VVKRALLGLAAVILLAAGGRDQSTTTRTTTRTTRDAAPAQPTTRSDDVKRAVHVNAPVNVDMDRNNPSWKKVIVEVK
jgi:hypothetical protein